MTLVNGKALVFSVPVTMTCEILGSSGLLFAEQEKSYKVSLQKESCLQNSCIKQELPWVHSLPYNMERTRLYFPIIVRIVY